MKISYNWLKEYIDTDLPPEVIAEMLTDTGLEVEGIEEMETVKGGLKGVVIGKILTCEPHPNADRLKVTTVDVGGEEPLHIVCGASNVAAGQKVPVATVGTIMYSNEGEFKIKKSKIRGEVSEGMICAEDELGLGQSHDGILVLSENAEIGTAAAEYFEVESDFVFEIGLTPNRTDAMSHYGVARDLRATLLRHGHPGIELALPSVASFKVVSQDLQIDIEIKDKEACPHYTGVTFSNVKVGPSPAWLQNRLRAIGVGPINNVVDITNYVLHETGHPLHAFDADEINGNKVVVKHLPQGTKFTTLDDKERELDENDLMICNESEGMVIAGVMGGKKSGVSEKTTKVFLESAYFNPVSVRKTAKRHALNTDSSFRYERGVDPEMTVYALKRAAILINEIAGGEVSMNIKDEHPGSFENVEVTLNLDRMNTLIGQEIEVEMVRNILTSLDIQIKGESARDLLLSIPPYRADVTREADVVEEVLRIYGFNAIDFNDRMRISVAPTDPHDESKYREKLSEMLSGRGFNEIMNNSLTKPQYFQDFGFNADESVEMLNPLSQDLAVMRQSLAFGGLETVARNVNRQRPDLKLYEFGKAYFKTQKGYRENHHLGIWISGNSSTENWETAPQKSSFFTLKGEVNAVLQALGISYWQEEEVQAGLFAYALEYKINKKTAVKVGRISDKAAKLAEVKTEVFYADLDWEYLATQAAKQRITFKEIPRYPEVRRDLALLLNEKVKYGDLVESARKAERKLLKDINLFDVYQGKNLPEGKKSYALSFILRDEEKTLNDKQVDKVMENILQSLKKDFEAELR